MLEAVDETTPRQRVLWLKQPVYPDNYLDESFLQDLQRNVNVRKYTYKSLLIDTLPVTQHVSLIMVFIAVFTWLYVDLLSHKTLISITLSSTCVGYFWWEKLNDATYPRVSALASGVTLTLILLLISPILQTLTKATTSDSIWPLSGGLFLLNAILAEYGVGETSPKTAGHFPSSLSLNAAIAASAVLSSRLDSNFDVFALMLFSIMCFALLPLLRREIRRSHSISTRMLLTVGTTVSAVVLLATVSLSTSALFAASICALQFGIPLWLLRLQSLKNELRGPWDAAVPKIANVTVQF